MNLIEKIERALVLAKELGLNDNQTKELMALILELPYFKLNLNTPAINAPHVPIWPTTLPSYPSDTIITCCSCSTFGQPHASSCEAVGINNGHTVYK